MAKKPGVAAWNVENVGEKKKKNGIAAGMASALARQALRKIAATGGSGGSVAASWRRGEMKAKRQTKYQQKKINVKNGEKSAAYQLSGMALNNESGARSSGALAPARKQ
jgi:hypothetical protein